MQPALLNLRIRSTTTTHRPHPGKYCFVCVGAGSCYQIADWHAYCTTDTPRLVRCLRPLRLGNANFYFSEKVPDPKDPNSPTIFYITEEGKIPTAYNPCFTLRPISWCIRAMWKTG